MVSPYMAIRLKPRNGSNPDFLLGGRTSASAECRHWSGRAVRWSSCAILLSRDQGGALRAVVGSAVARHCPACGDGVGSSSSDPLGRRPGVTSGRPPTWPPPRRRSCTAASARRPPAGRRPGVCCDKLDPAAAEAWSAEGRQPGPRFSLGCTGDPAWSLTSGRPRCWSRSRRLSRFHLTGQRMPGVISSSH